MGKDRSQLAKELFNQQEKLTLDNPIYKQWVFRYTFLELEKDLDENGDITTNGLIHKKKAGKARIYANEKGILSGGDEVHYFLTASNSAFRPHLRTLSVIQRLEDGKQFDKDDMIIEIEGDIRDILKAERVILNLLQHMSGITTYSKKIIDKAKKANPNVLVVPTRKTTWGLLDKKAVTIAGGGTHRLNLSDAVLIKDNHLSIFKNDIKSVLQKFRPPLTEYKFFEIEIDDPKEVINTTKLCYELQKKNALPKPVIIMLDNISSVKIKEIIDKIYTEEYKNNFLFEASGGIKEENIDKYAKTGVDIISMGSLTQKIKPIDLSLEIGIT